MPGSGWPRPDKLNGGFIGFLSSIALFALVVVVCFIGLLLAYFVFLWFVVFLNFALLFICLFLFE